jgi:lysozyme family protein
MNFDQAFDHLIGHEGGYVNSPADPGGETKFGISKRSYPQLDIKALTLDQAKTIYLADYWTKAGCPKVPEAVRFDLFDMAVNSGIEQAIRVLQQAVFVTADGAIGPNTLTALSATDPYKLMVRFNALRLAFMAGLSNWPVFSRGWALRIVDNLLEL